jgi:hypothetical protein
MAKENLKLVLKIQDYLKSGKTKPNENELIEFGVDVSKQSQMFRNIMLEKNFWGKWVLNIIDPLKDLDGKLISENNKLLQRLKALYENGIKEINLNDFMELNIITPATELKIGNFKLEATSLMYVYPQSYHIMISDKNRNIDGLWLDSVITSEKVLEVLHKFDIAYVDLIKLTEVQLNKLIEEHFKKYFENVKKSGTSNKGLIDLLIGSNQNYAIELKLARELKKSSVSQRAIGQIDLYMEQFNHNFMVIIAGSAEEKREKYIQDLIKKVKKTKGLTYYMEAN